MAESPTPIRSDGRLSQAGLERVGESTSRQESLFGGMSRISMTGGEGPIQNPAESFWVRIDEVGSDGQYSVTEVARTFGQTAGLVDQPAGDPRKWVIGNNPAYEVNLSTDVAVDSIHRAWNSGEQGVIEFDASKGATPVKCEDCLALICVVKTAGVVTDIQYVNSMGQIVTIPLCAGPTMPCCTPPQPLPRNLNFRFLSSPSSVDSPISGYLAAWTNASGITKQRPTYLANNPATAPQHLSYSSFTDCALLTGVVVPLIWNGAHYQTVANTNCSAYVDAGGTSRSIEAARYRIATGVLNGLPIALDVTVSVYPCLYQGGVLVGYWALFVTLRIVYTRPPFGSCDINSVTTVGSNFGFASSNPGFQWNWTWQSPAPRPPAPACVLVNADPCNLARPIDLLMGATCPGFCSDFGCAPFGYHSVPDGVISTTPTDFYGFSIGLNGTEGGGIDVNGFPDLMIANCPSQYIERVNVAPPFFADPDKTGQLWSFRGEIFE